MKQFLTIALVLFSISSFAVPKNTAGSNKKADSLWVRRNYEKREIAITMRDGKQLYTAIYSPKDNKSKHPILLFRTPYSIAPYGRDSFKAFWDFFWVDYLKEGYIMVLQDVRGRYMSEGDFVDVRPFNPEKGEGDIDESTDTYDTIDWLVNNLKNSNGKVGVLGISYPGFYATQAALCGHPALKAVSPQAPVTDWFAGDDFHHNGAFMLMDGFNFYSGFGKPRPAPTKHGAKGFDNYGTKDNYKFFLETGSLRNFRKLMGDSIKFWSDMYEHPNYDDWWQARNARKYVSHIPDSVATLVVGGLFDAEDCFGAWNLYKAIEKNAHNNNRLVMGPWQHGGWARTTGEHLGNVRFGSKTSEWYQKHIEEPFFRFYLQDKGDITDIKEANIYFSGGNEWRTFDKWPPEERKNKAFYLQPGGGLSLVIPEKESSSSKYISDPAHPVPYTEDVHFNRTAEYMDDDQRFASRRPDVLTFTSGPLTDDLMIGGPVTADLFVSISTTDADFVVKLIDVFPDDFSYDDKKDGAGWGKDYPMGGYQMLVRGDVMRGRYRNSLSEPEPFKPEQVTEVKFNLPDVAHVFKKGHKIMVQVQSTWFPLVDRNPQQNVNIYRAYDDDFVKSTIKVFHEATNASKIILPTLNPVNIMSK
ncbi:MAG: CocE/NonD family hydrolase [Bacteroidetes bacterium]|nr:CocE/NonD family hydrolase [Bacteroidota bacterium]